MANPNIANTTSILGVTAVASSVATSSGTTVLSAVPSNKVYKLNSVTVANKTGSAANCTVSLVRSETDYHLAYQISIPANATLNVLGKDMQIYMQEGDALKIIAGTSSALDAVVSYEEIS